MTDADRVIELARSRHERRGQAYHAAADQLDVLAAANNRIDKLVGWRDAELGDFLHEIRQIIEDLDHIIYTVIEEYEGPSA